MTQVWMLRNSDTDIHLFNRRDHIMPSIRISYYKCLDVKIEGPESDDGYASETYIVSGHYAPNYKDGAEFKDTLVFRRLPVWTEPCHL